MVLFFIIIFTQYCFIIINYLIIFTIGFDLKIIIKYKKYSYFSFYNKSSRYEYNIFF
jgi:hypothetical protein